jgi:nucleoside-diphosphate kinase
MRWQTLLLIGSLAASDAAQDCEKRTQRTFAMVKPDAVGRADEIVEMARRRGLFVVAFKTMTLTPGQAALFYREHRARAFFESLVDFMTSGPVVVLVFEGPDAVSGWRQLIGPTNSEKARLEGRESVRARYGTDGQRNAVHGSDSRGSARREIDFFFGTRAVVPIRVRLAWDRVANLFGLVPAVRRLLHGPST